MYTVWGWGIYALKVWDISVLNWWDIYNLNGWCIYDSNGWDSCGKVSYCFWEILVCSKTLVRGVPFPVIE